MNRAINIVQLLKRDEPSNFTPPVSTITFLRVTVNYTLGPKIEGAIYLHVSAQHLAREGNTISLVFLLFFTDNVVTPPRLAITDAPEHCSFSRELYKFSNTAISEVSRDKCMLNPRNERTSLPYGLTVTRTGNR